MAGTVATDIEAHRSSLRPVVDSMAGQWVGTSYQAFLPAHEQWEAGITRLVAALNAVGESTRFSSNTYSTADQDSAVTINAAGAQSPFGGALQG